MQSIGDRRDGARRVGFEFWMCWIFAVFETAMHFALLCLVCGGVTNSSGLRGSDLRWLVLTGVIAASREYQILASAWEQFMGPYWACGEGFGKSN